MNKLYKPTIFRILTNNTINCILIVLLLFIGVQFFFPFTEQYLFVVSIMLEITIVIAICILTYMEYHYSYLTIDKNSLTHFSISSKKRSVTINIKDIDNVVLEKYSIKIYYQNKKLVLDYYKELDEIYHLIKK